MWFSCEQAVNAMKEVYFMRNFLEEVAKGRVLGSILYRGNDFKHVGVL